MNYTLYSEEKRIFDIPDINELVQYNIVTTLGNLYGMGKNVNESL